jgi:hypothetical protein
LFLSKQRKNLKKQQVLNRDQVRGKSSKSTAAKAKGKMAIA